MTAFALLLISLIALAIVSALGNCSSRRRHLIDSYGLDNEKLKTLSCEELKNLHNKVYELQKNENAIAIDALLRAYRS